MLLFLQREKGDKPVSAFTKIVWVLFVMSMLGRPAEGTVILVLAVLAFLFTLADKQTARDESPKP